MKLDFVEMYEVVGVLPISAYYETGQPFASRLKELGYYGYDHFLWYYHDGMGKAFCEKSEMEKSAQEYFGVFTKEERLSELIGKINQAIADIQKFTEEAKKTDLKKLSTKELLDVELRRREQEENIFCYYNLTQPENADVIEFELRKELEQKIENTSEIDQVLGKLTAEDKLSKTGQEELDWLRLVLEAKSGEKIGEKLEKHFQKYIALMLGDGEWNPKIDVLNKRLEKDLTLETESVKNRILELECYPQNVRAEKNELQTKYDLSEKANKLSEIAAKIGHIRFEMRMEGWLPFFYYAYSQIELAERLKISPKAMQYATYKEFLSLFGHNPLASPEELNKRAEEETYLMVVEKDNINIFYGEEAVKGFDSLVKSETTEQDQELVGMTAMLGKAEGTAYVYIWGDDVEEAASRIKENTILVAGQTRPQIMPIIRKCVGIITDEGGITSHAAIVARELKIPCIVGTKVATKVIKTGDKLILDANNGNARIVR